MMKKTFLALLGLLMLTGCKTPQTDVPIRVISYNVRLSAAAATDKENRWELRRDASVKMINEEEPLIIGLQEACPDQIAFLDEQLPLYQRIGVGRDEGRAEGEMMAIYYRQDLLTLDAGGTFWLSETPDSVSQGWDAACKRTCTWALFTHKASGRRVAHLNTHLDHLGAEARREGLRLICTKMEELVPADVPVFLTGDFNATTGEAIFEPIHARLLDARAVAPTSDHSTTFNAFSQDPARAATIDHIFFRGAEPLRFAVLRGDYGAPYISDHYPVLLEATF